MLLVYRKARGFQRGTQLGGQFKVVLHHQNAHQSPPFWRKTSSVTASTSSSSLEPLGCCSSTL